MVKITKDAASKKAKAEFAKHTKGEAVTEVVTYNDEYLCCTSELGALRLFHAYRDTSKQTHVIYSVNLKTWTFRMEHGLGNMLDDATS